MHKPISSPSFTLIALVGALVSFGILSLAGSIAVAQQGSECAFAKCAYTDPSLPLEKRVKDLVGRMTLEEKVSQMMDVAVAIPRLNVPEYNWWSEALHGVARNGAATNFPQSIGLAATFDTELMRHVGDVIATEGRAKYNEAIRYGDHSRYAGLTFWSPNVNIFRDPRWGRGQETFGEDPFLSSRMGVQFVEGLQGDDPKYLKVIATPKHFAVHSGPEPARHGFNVDISGHDLEDTYLPAFRAAIMEGKADSIMCAYNAIDGFPACASDMLLQQHLRDAWKFNGYVVSDCDAIADINHGHHFAPDNEHASAAAVKAGTDLDCGGAYKALVAAVRQGVITEAGIDTAVERLFTARFRLGMFDLPEQVAFNRIPLSANNTAASRQLALQAARESIVLLKNNGALPLNRNVHTIAVVGPTADMLEVLEGNYNGTPRHPVTPLEGMRKRFGSIAKVTYSAGSILVEGLSTPIPAMYLRPSASSTEQGLKAEYFDNVDFSGAPKVVRIDRKINFDWNRIAPAEGLPVNRFAVRWTGELVPPAAGEYTIGFRGPRGVIPFGPGGAAVKPGAPPLVRYRLYVDDKLLLDSKSQSAGMKMTFADTQPHRIRLEYIHVADERFIDLEWQPPASALLEPALQAATAADVVVVFVGLSPNLEGEEMNVHADGFDGGDRTNITLPAAQESLIEALGHTGKPLIVVLTSGSAVTSVWAQEHAAAMLEAWYPGEEGGTAIADTLAGDSNPSGRLPVTFYRAVGDLPPFASYAMGNRTYRYFTGPVLYPFGYGMSYSKFAYSGLKLSADSLQAGDKLTATVVVHNTSQREGDEVAELYLKTPKTNVSPQLALEGFMRLHLKAGESKQIEMQLDARQMSQVDKDGKRSVVPGTYTLSIGGGQPDAVSTDGVTAQYHVTGSMPLPE